MTLTDEELVSACLDGEPVDATALAQALSRPEARDALVDFMLLRARVLGDPAHPRSDFEPRVRRRMEAETVPWWSRRLGRSAAAAAAVVAVATSYWLGSLEGRPVIPTEPPQPTRTVAFEPGVDWQW
jgi:anti-sigma factor RsiW